MARITPDELWRLLVETGLCSRSAAATLRAEHDRAAAARDEGAHAVAAWLVERGTTTPWQAKRLAVGDTGPFFYGDYRLLERHEHDGDAFEFTARHEPTGRIVTVVLMARRHWRDATVRAAIERRMAIAARATDPLLVRAHAIEEADGRPFAVCEEVRGVALADELDRRGPPGLRAAGEVALAVARAVAELHAAGEVHGGLSLDALVREPQEAGGGLRLRQFPLAGDPHQVPPRALVADAEELFQLGRRAAFVAPELVGGAACDARSDVYAIGCILHALVTGRPPHWSGDARETLDRAAAGPGRLDPDLAPPPLATLVDYLTAPDPRDRYPEAGEAARAIATTFGFPQPELAAVPVAPAVPTREAPASRAVIAAAAARRRGRWLRLVGTVLAGAILAATAAIVIVKTAPEPRRRIPRAEDTAVDDPAVEDPAVAAVALPPRDVEPPSPEEPPEPVAAPPGPRIVDDPTLPWTSPTAGRPPVFQNLPAGSQVVVTARPAALLADEEGRLFVRALGPAVAGALGEIAAACGCTPERIETLQAGWQSGDGDQIVVGWTARLVEGATLPTDAAWRTRAWGPSGAAPGRGETIHSGKTFSYWAPTSAAGRVLVAAPATRLVEVVEASAAAAPALILPADLERLAAALDDDRHLTVIASPHYLLNRGRGLLAGPLEPVAAEIEALLGESVQAAALSVHCGTDFYVELDAATTVDLPPRTFAARLAERFAAYPAAVEAFCAARDLHPYGRALVSRLPTMVLALAANVRSGPEDKLTVANAYLPRHAGHNIALAAELALAQAAAGNAAAPAVVAAPAAPQDALGRLGRTMTLVFAKDTLEKAIQMVADEVGVPIEILGGDLELDSITKNQSFTLDERDKPAAAILRVILAKADPAGKLVYVVRRQDGVESLVITTLTAAQKRGDTLPPEFQEAGKPAKRAR